MKSMRASDYYDSDTGMCSTPAEHYPATLVILFGGFLISELFAAAFVVAGGWKLILLPIAYLFIIANLLFGKRVFEWLTS